MNMPERAGTQPAKEIRLLIAGENVAALRNEIAALQAAYRKVGMMIGMNPDKAFPHAMALFHDLAAELDV